MEVCKFYNPYFKSGCQNGRYCSFKHLKQSEFLEYCDEQSKFGPDSYARRAFNRAVHHFKFNEFQQCMNILRKLLFDYPLNAQYNIWCARCHEKLFENMSAEFFYRKAIAIQPSNATFHGRYAAFSHFKLRNNKQAKIHYEKSLSIRDNLNAVHCHFAKFVEDVDKNWKLAEIHYKKCLSLFADDEECNFYYAQLLHKMGNYNEAKYHFKRALLLQKRPYIWHYFEYALLLSEMKEFDEAIKHFEICVSLNANVAKVNYEYGLFLFENNIDKEKGLKLIKKSSEINPSQIKYEQTLNRICYSQEKNFENIEKNDQSNNNNKGNQNNQQIIIGNNSNHNIINIQNYGYEKNEIHEPYSHSLNNTQTNQSQQNQKNIVINVQNNNTVCVKNDEKPNNNNIYSQSNQSNQSHDSHHSIVDRIIADFEIDLGIDIVGNNHHNHNHNHNNNNNKISDYETKEEEKDDIINKYSDPDIFAVNEFKRILTEYIFGSFEFEEDLNIKDTDFIQSLQLRASEYYKKFEELNINDIRLLEFIDGKTLQYKIGMNSEHINIFMQNIKKFKKECDDFIQYLKNLDVYNDYYDAFETYGIITFSSFGYHCKTVQDIACIINKGNKNILLNIQNEKHNRDALRMIEKYNAMFSHYI